MAELKTYRKRPIELQAIQWTGENEAEIQAWTGRSIFYKLDVEDRGENPDATATLYVAANSVWLGLEPGEWILKDSKGFYPCKPDVFAETYEEVTEPREATS